MSVSGKQPFSFDLTARVAAANQRPAGAAQWAASPADGPDGLAVPAAPVCKRVCMRIPADLHASAKAAALAEGITVTDMVVGALRMRLARPELFEAVWESQRQGSDA